MDLAAFNLLPAHEAIAAVFRCCGSTRWAERMIAARPFRDFESLHRQAVQVWNSLEPKDWLEAFSHHPRLGGQTHAHASTEKWAKQEQSATAHASVDTLKALAEGNAEYEARFGRVFLLCATGKSAEEMLDNLRKRLKNPPDEELRIAAAEQEKITRLRLDKLFHETRNP